MPCSLNCITAVIPCHKITQDILRIIITNRDILSLYDIETICVLNGDNVDAKKLVENGIKYFYQKKASRPLARNLGVSLAMNEYVFFIDSDCELIEFDRDSLFDIIKENPNAIQGQVKAHVSGTSIYNKILLDKYLKYQILNKNGISRFGFDTCCLIVRTKDFLRVGGFKKEISRCEDLELFYNYIYSGVEGIIITDKIRVKKTIDKSAHDFWTLNIIDMYFWFVVRKMYRLRYALEPRPLEYKINSRYDLVKLLRLILVKYSAPFIYLYVKLVYIKSTMIENPIFKLRYNSRIFHCDLSTSKILRVENIS